jgi:signal transduction histidine kinase
LVDFPGKVGLRLLSHCGFVLTLAAFVCLTPAHAQSNRYLARPAHERIGFANPVDARVDAHTKRILLLQQRGYAAPSGPAFDAAFANEMRAFQADLYAEVIEQSRFPGPDYLNAVRAYLIQKYANRTFDVVVTVGLVPLTLVRENRAMFGNPPVVAIVGPRGYIDTGAGVTGLEAANSVGGTIDLSLTLLPGTRRVVVIDSARVNRAPMESEFRQRMAERPEIELEYLRDLSMDQAVARAAALPAGSVLHFVKQSMRNSAEDIDQFEALEQISRVSTAPLFVHFEDYIGHGALGGHVWQPAADAAVVAQIAQRLASGATPSEIPVGQSAHRHVVDWRQLQRWNIPEARLPAGTLVLHRPRSLFAGQQSVIIAIALLAVQLVLVVGLLIQRRRRHAVEAKLQQGAVEAQLAWRRNQELAGRLLTAHEAERSRIARDLHDGVCQEVASVTVDLSYLRRNIDDAEAQAALLAIQRRTSNVAETLRLISHHLHPSLLNYIGLVAALQGHCSEAERRHGMVVKLNAQPDAEPSDKKTSLALFRIAEEALRNAAVHGSARHVTISLERAERGGSVLVMTVVDDGKGFDVAAARRGAGLGLLSIEEHARLVRGQALVRSQPGRTVVEVLVPFEIPDADTPTEDIAC